jgi:hypothetical protein
MSRLPVVAVSLLAVVGFGSPASSEGNGRHLAVWPRSASALPPISLSELIFRAIPRANKMSWEDLQIPNVQWITDGIAYYPNDGEPYRQGLAHIRASGATSTLLRQRTEELSWTVTLSTEDNEKWGPTTLTITPGLTEAKYKGQYMCFGTGFSGCAFPISSIRNPKIRYVQQCVIGFGANQSIVFRATTADGRRGTVIYRGSGGSGGTSNYVELSTLTPIEYCQRNKDRGY